MNTYIFLFGS